MTDENKYYEWKSKYYGWKLGNIHGLSLGNNKIKAIKQAKQLGLDMVLKVGKENRDGEWMWESKKAKENWPPINQTPF